MKVILAVDSNTTQKLRQFLRSRTYSFRAAIAVLVFLSLFQLSKGIPSDSSLFHSSQVIYLFHSTTNKADIEEK